MGGCGFGLWGWGRPVSPVPVSPVGVVSVVFDGLEGSREIEYPTRSLKSCPTFFFFFQKKKSKKLEKKT